MTRTVVDTSRLTDGSIATGLHGRLLRVDLVVPSTVIHRGIVKDVFRVFGYELATGRPVESIVPQSRKWMVWG